MGSDATTAKKAEQLGMNPGTAYNRLHKKMLLHLLYASGREKCYRCGKMMVGDEVSLDHIIPWLDHEYAEELFWNPLNIAFSHKSCNYAAARKNKNHSSRVKVEKVDGRYFAYYTYKAADFERDLKTDDLFEALITARTIEDKVFGGE